MQFNFYKVSLKKRFPLSISRGVHSHSENLFVRYENDGLVGWGEGAPGSTEGATSVEEIQTVLETFIATGIEGYSIQELYDRAREMGIPPCAYVALDTAFWDWTAKKAQLPLRQILGFPKAHTPTSITIGINPPEVVKQRIPLLLDGTTVKSLKIKLGSPEGIEADKEMFTQVHESSKDYSIKIRVDANGGWDVAQAQHMMQWLADRKVDYIEQPLKEGEEDYIQPLKKVNY